MSWVALLLALSVGWFLSSALTAEAWKGPRWMTILAEASLAALFGPGLTSVVFFFMVTAGIATPPAVFTMLVVLTLLSAGLWWKLRRPSGQSSARHFPWTWVLVSGSIVALLMLLLNFQVFSQANPTGGWDASAIWNVRARYLAGGSDTWRRAVSAEIGGHLFGASHPNYPLFLSSFVAMQWMASGNLDTAVPIAGSLLFSMAVLILLGASLATSESLALGLLAWLVLLASDVFTSQISAQYADLLLGLSFLAGLVLLDRAHRSGSSPRLLFAAGLAIGFAPWIKNEGWPFAIAAIGIAVWHFWGRAIIWILLGALPGLLASTVLKILSEGREATIPRTMGDALLKISDARRWWEALVGFATAVWNAGPLWAHPLLLVTALAIVLRCVPAADRRTRRWLWIPIAATLAAEYGLFLVTTADLSWHISTSVNRLVAQVWPSLLWLVFLTLRAPEDYFSTPEQVVNSSIKKKNVRVSKAVTGEQRF
jgi:hypothetical protein